MALAAGTVWEIRTTGNSANGGGYNSARAGATTDFSVQDSPQVTYTDLVIGASNTVTSVAFPFTSLHIGNILNITGGVGFTTGRYEVISVASAAATLDRSPGALASTGGTGRLGGAADHLSTLASVYVAGNILWVKAGTYAFTSQVDMVANGTDQNPVVFRGYGTTRGDEQQAVLQATAVIAASIVQFSGKYSYVENLTFDGNDQAQFGGNFNDTFCYLYNCWAKNATRVGFHFIATHCRATRCLATGCGAGLSTGGGFDSAFQGALFEECVARDNDAHGFVCNGTTVQYIHCIAHGNVGAGFFGSGSNAAARLSRCTSYGNTGSGYLLTSTDVGMGDELTGCIFAGNARYGIESDTTNYATVPALALKYRQNAFYNNTLGARFQVPAGATDVTLTADPFVDAANDDFALNFNVGGGLDVRSFALGYGLLTSPEPSVGAIDAGAVPSTGASIGTLSSMRSLWRELTGEHDTDVVPDAIVDVYVQRGLEALNRRTEYHVEDLSITLTATTQEYALDGSVLRIIWVEHNGVELTKRDVEDWRRSGEPWRLEPQGTPSEWAHYAQKIVLRPTPNAAAVADDSTLLVRAVTNPRALATYGFEQLADQEMPLAVYEGAALWSACYPDSALATVRRDFLHQSFETEAQSVAADAGAKEVSR